MAKKAAKKVIGRKAMKKTKGGSGMAIVFEAKGGHTNTSAAKGASTGRYYDGMTYQER